MTDIKSGINPLFLREEELRQAVELLYLSYRNITYDSSNILTPLGFGLAHQRAIYFIGRHPCLSVTDLLKILAITKQSLSRVLSELVSRGYVRQHVGTTDRRRRHLELTEAGLALERQLWAGQRQRIARAYRKAGAGAVEGFRNVLLGLIEERDRLRITDQGGGA